MRYIPVKSWLLYRLLVLLVLVGGCRQTGAPPAADSVAETQIASGANEPEVPDTSHNPINFPLTAQDYPWPQTAVQYEPLVKRFRTPRGFNRVKVTTGSWAEWLRHLPLLPAQTPVRSREGNIILPGNSPWLGAVIDMDVRKNQECADTIMRLWAEYLLLVGQDSEIAFPVSGGDISWLEWKRGTRPRLVGNYLRFSRTAEPDSSRRSFERYLDAVCAWCGTYSLVEASRPVPLSDIRIGDLFVHGGTPGHAVLVADLASTTEWLTKALLLQGFMPAQSAHVVNLDANTTWYGLRADRRISIPMWGEFGISELRRFR